MLRLPLGRLTRYHGLLLAGCLVCFGVVATTDGIARWSLLALTFLLISAVAAYGVTHPQIGLFGPALCSVPTAKPLVALTFDDGPDPKATPALLALLARRQVPATFFCVGEHVARHPEICRGAAQEGHQIENHSWAHRRTTNLFSVPRLHHDLMEAQHQITQVTGRSPTCFRPPMGLTNLRVFRVTEQLGLRVVGWSTGGHDQCDSDPERTVGRVLRRLHPGGIVLLHDGGVPADRLTTTVELLIDNLDARGYQCVRLDQLVQSNDQDTKPAAA
jgi:peptidoglycan/xylan/chitin deacetylase (PgdA/CDA1 family)